MKRNRFTEEQIIGIEGARSQGFSGRSVPQVRRQRRQHLKMEGEVRPDGRLGGQAEDAGGREREAEAAPGRRHARQCGVEASALKAA